MLKPGSLRKHLTAALPELARDPEKLVVMAGSGRAICTGTGTLSFEYAYTLQIIVLDYAGHADAVIVPLIAWVSRNQPELLDNEQKRANAIRFDVEYLTDQTIDLSIEIDLTERVLVRPREGTPGGLNVIHVGEPLHPAHTALTGNVEQHEHWSLWLRDELLAEWDHDPR